MRRPGANLPTGAITTDPSTASTWAWPCSTNPGSYRHPTNWHVRTYGLFTANAFGSKALDKTQPSKPTELAAGERLKLRHRFLFHREDEKQAKIAEAYAEYAKQ